MSPYKNYYDTRFNLKFYSDSQIIDFFFQWDTSHGNVM